MNDAFVVAIQTKNEVGIFLIKHKKDSKARIKKSDCRIISESEIFKAVIESEQKIHLINGNLLNLHLTEVDLLQDGKFK